MTERQYFEYIRRLLKDYLLTIEVAKDRGDPLKLVEAAVAARDGAAQHARRDRDDNLRYDQVWCVLDVDDHQRLDAALKLAAEEDIRVAVSNPCFEFWILLHYVECRAHLTTAATQRTLKKHLPDYDKRLDCRAIKGRYEIARSRAQDLAMQHERDDKDKNTNPSSDVWHLVDELLAAARRFDAPVRLTSL